MQNIPTLALVAHLMQLRAQINAEIDQTTRIMMEANDSGLLLPLPSVTHLASLAAATSNLCHSRAEKLLHEYAEEK